MGVLNNLVIEHILNTFGVNGIWWEHLSRKEAKDAMVNYAINEGVIFFFLERIEDKKFEVLCDFEQWKFKFFRDETLVESIDLPKNKRGLIYFLATFDYDFVMKEIESIDILFKHC